MMSSKEIRNEMLAGIISAPSFSNGYAEKLGVTDRYGSIRDSNLYVLEDFIKKLVLVEELIKNYELEGNNLNSEIAFKELKINIDLIFKPKGFFSFFS